MHLVKNVNTGKTKIVYSVRDLKLYDRLAHYTVVGECDRHGVPLEQDDPKPSTADRKKVWVEYAIAQGMDPDEASECSKAELVERYS